MVFAVGYMKKEDASRCPQDICHMLAGQRYRFDTFADFSFDRPVI